MRAYRSLLLCGLLVLRIPMLVSVAAAVFFNYYFSNAWMMTMPQTMMSGLGRFVLIALPLFVLAGGLMNAGGISGRLFEFARAIVGSLRGGAGPCQCPDKHVLRRHDRFVHRRSGGNWLYRHSGNGKERISGDFAAALTASSSGIGPMIPPEFADDPIFRRHRRVAGRIVSCRRDPRPSAGAQPGC